MQYLFPGSHFLLLILDCSLSRIVSRLERLKSFSLLIRDWTKLSRGLDSSSALREKLRCDIQSDKIKVADALEKLLEDWRTRNSSSAKLVTLLEIFGSTCGWIDIKGFSFYLLNLLNFEPIAYLSYIQIVMVLFKLERCHMGRILQSV